MASFCILKLQTNLDGNFRRMVLTPVNRPMQPFLKDPSSLAHGEEFGKLGLLRDASSSFGWSFTTGFGQLIV